MSTETLVRRARAFLPLAIVAGLLLLPSVVFAQVDAGADGGPASPGGPLTSGDTIVAPPWAPAWVQTVLMALGGVSLIATILGSLLHIPNSAKVNAVGEGVRRVGLDVIGLFLTWTAPDAPAKKDGAK